MKRGHHTMKRFATLGVIVILIFTGLGVYWMRKSGNNGAEGGNDSSSLNIDSIKTFRMKRSRPA
jgi:hypothetical protein